MSATLGAGFAGLLIIGLARAQDATPPDLRMDAHGPTLPPGDPDAPLTLWSPAARPRGTWSASVQLEEVEGALFMTAGGQRVPALTHLVGANIGATWQIARRAGVGAAVPVWLTRGAADATGALATEGPALGDLHVWAPIGLVLGERGGLQLIPVLGLPTGAAGAHLGEEGLTYGASLAPGVRVGPLTVSGEVGLIRRPEVAAGPLQSFGGTEWRFGGAAGARVGPVRLGLEVRGAAPLSLGADPGRSPVEALLVVGGRSRGGAWARAAGGAGLTSGIGSPDFRGILGVGYVSGVDEVAAPDAVEPVELGVRVLDPAGAPVPGATIFAGDAVVATTDRDGRATLPTDRALLRRGIAVAAPGYARREVPFGDDGQAAATLEWLPVPVDVRVQDQAGLPVAAAFEIRQLPADGEAPADAPWTRVDGPLALLPGRWEVRTSAEGAGAQIRRVDVRPAQATPVEVVVLPAAGDAGLALALTDPEGRPVVGARVLVDGQPVGVSGAAGDLALAGLAAGPHDLVIRTDAFTERQLPGVVIGGDTALPVVLERVPGSVRVAVHGPDGRPVADAVLRFDGPRRLAPTPVGETGERTQVLGPGDWSLLVTSAAYGFQERAVHVPADSWQLVDVDIVLQAQEEGAADLLIRVVDADGEPVDGASVALDGRPLGRTSTGGELRLQRLDVGPRELAVEAPWHRPVAVPELDVHEGYQETVVTLDWVAGATRVRALTPGGPVGDAVVRFTGPATVEPRPLGLDGAEIVELGPGTWTALVTSPTAGFHEAQVVVPPDDRALHRVDALLGAGEEGTVKLQVQVVDPDRQPVDGALVRLDGEPAGLTSDAGALTLAELDPGRRRLVVEAPPLLDRAEATATLRDADAELTVPLGWAAGTAAVTVVDAAGAPVTDAILRIDGSRRIEATPVGPDGARRFALGAGDWQVLATSTTRGFAEAPVSLSAADRMKPVTIRMEPVAAGRAELLVRVRDADGAPVGGARVTGPGIDAVTGAGGNLLLDDLEPGDRALAVSAPGFRDATLALALDEGATERFAVLEWIPRDVAVTVTDRAGAPVDAEIALVGPDDRDPLRTGPDGVETVRVRPGTWQVIASTDTLGPAKAEIVVADAGGAVTLALEPTRVELTGEKVLIRDRVTFELDSANLGPGSRAILQQVADALLARTDLVRVEVQGHTDDLGTVAYNQELSQRRAEAVARALVELGVPPEKVVAVGYGMQRPLVPNDTDAHRAENRRVAFELEAGR